MFKLGKGFRVEHFFLNFMLAAELAKEFSGKYSNVAAPLSKRWNGDTGYRNSIKKIRAETALFNFFAQVPIGCGNKAKTHFSGGVFPNATY